MVGFLQLSYQFRSFLPISVDTLGVQVDDDVGYYQQKKNESRQPSDLQERPLTHGGYLRFPSLQISLYLSVHLAD